MRWTFPGSFNLATQVAELMSFLVEAQALSGISIFCLSIFWQVAFVTMSNLLYLSKAFIITHPGKVASYSVTLFTAIAVPSFQVSERAKSRVVSLVKNKISTQVINSSIIHP